jgi:hypothetical protein
MALFARLDTLVEQRLPGTDEAASLQFLKARGLVEQHQDAAALALVTPLLSRENHPWRARIVALHGALSGLQR